MSRKSGYRFSDKDMRKRKATAMRFLRGAFILVALVWQTAASAQPADLATLALDQAADRTERLIAGAKREGELMIYSSMQHESIAPLQKGFEEKYGVKLRIWRGAGKDILRRVTTEAKASRFELDVVESDGFALEALHREALLQRVRSPFHPNLMAQALQSHAEWVGTRLNISVGVYNTDRIKRETLPKSYDDLLQPRFKGQLGIETDDYDWFGMLVGLLGEERGLQLFREIVARNGLSVRKGHTLLTNLAAAGEVPIGLDVFLQNVEVAKKNGGPVDWFAMSPTLARPNGVAVARRAPHPYAALLFYDFMLSDGQQIMTGRQFIPTSLKVPSVRDRLTLNFVDPAIVLDGGAKWQKIYTEVVRSGGR
jgi:iron(III) transport system substrate-binding protein